MRELHAEVKQALRGFERWSIRHVRREHNAEADRLVNEALDGLSRADRSRRRHRPRPPQGRRHRPLARLLLRRARLRAAAALRRRRGLRLGRRLPPPHRPQHLALEGRLAAAAAAPPASSTSRSATRPARALADALRRLIEAGVPLERRLRPRRQRGALPRRPRRQRRRALLGPAEGGVAARRSRARRSRCTRARSTSRACSPSPSSER